MSILKALLWKDAKQMSKNYKLIIIILIFFAVQILIFYIQVIISFYVYIYIYIYHKLDIPWDLQIHIFNENTLLLQK